MRCRCGLTLLWRGRVRPCASGCWPDMSGVRLHPSACGGGPDMSRAQSLPSATGACGRWPDMSRVRLHPCAGGRRDGDDCESLRCRCCRVWPAVDQRGVFCGRLQSTEARQHGAGMCNGGLVGCIAGLWPCTTAVDQRSGWWATSVYGGSPTQRGHLRRRTSWMSSCLQPYDRCRAASARSPCARTRQHSMVICNCEPVR